MSTKVRSHSFVAVIPLAQGETRRKTWHRSAIRRKSREPCTVSVHRSSAQSVIVIIHFGGAGKVGLKTLLLCLMANALDVATVNQYTWVRGRPDRHGKSRTSENKRSTHRDADCNHKPDMSKIWPSPSEKEKGAGTGKVDKVNRERHCHITVCNKGAGATDG